MTLSELATIGEGLHRAIGEAEDYICDYNAKAGSEMQRSVSFVVGEQTVDVNYLLRTRSALSKALDFFDKLNISGISFEEGKKK